ncbi:unnamed protein product [Phyllotreta striolata]|uniref:SLC26A/SulP transporter domain-containing protein n=1 Tax=Phyllotreta striolata TaxID=444603 RepID=A0A9N9XJ18_PHYSR|nr:unnamed protein product [Phyllotreta striolata]
MTADNLPSIKIERPLYEHNQLREDLMYEKTKKSRKWCKNISCRKIITSTIPSLGWIPKYGKTDFFSDLAAGFTVAIMHIPQGMAYALLGNVPPVVGIYMAVFPVLVYFFFGTSRHVSMGTFSIACLMTGKAVLEYSDPVYFKPATTNGSDLIFTSTSPTYTPSQVASAVTLVVAFIQLIMYFLRLGIASALLSEMLVNAFTAGAAVQIVITQCKDLIGITIPKVSGKLSGN